MIAYECLSWFTGKGPSQEQVMIFQKRKYPDFTKRKSFSAACACVSCPPSCQVSKIVSCAVSEEELTRTFQTGRHLLEQNIRLVHLSYHHYLRHPIMFYHGTSVGHSCMVLWEMKVISWFAQGAINIQMGGALGVPGGSGEWGVWRGDGERAMEKEASGPLQNWIELQSLADPPC